MWLTSWIWQLWLPPLISRNTRQCTIIINCLHVSHTAKERPVHVEACFAPTIRACLRQTMSESSRDWHVVFLNMKTAWHFSLYTYNHAKQKYINNSHTDHNHRIIHLPSESVLWELNYKIRITDNGILKYLSTLVLAPLAVLLSCNTNRCTPRVLCHSLLYCISK